MTRRWLYPCALLPMLVWAAPAVSKDPLDEMSRGEFKSALKLLDGQLKRASEPGQLAELHLLRAQCFNAIGQGSKARGAVEQALRQNPEARLPAPLENPVMTELIESVRGSLKGELSVTGGAPDAVVLIDGKSMGPPPLRVPVPIGRHTVELSAPGSQTAKKEVVVSVAGAPEVSFSASELTAVVHWSPPPEPPALPPPAEAPAPEPAVEAARPVPAAKSRLVPGLLIGGAAALVVAGVAGTVFAVSTKSRFDAQQSNPELLAAGGVTRAQAQTAQTVFALSLAASAAGLALAGVSLFQLLSPDRAGAAALVPIDGGAVLTVQYLIR